MSADDNDHDDLEDTDDVRDRIEQEADRAVEQFDEGIVDLLAWVLDTETRARIYVHLRQQPESTSEEIAEGTGLYPSTVREALAALTEEEVVTRQKRESDGAGNNPYEYSAISPSDLVNTIVGDIQSELNTVFNLDDHIGGETTLEPDDEPVTISVEDANDDDTSEESGSEEDGSENENDDADV
ncbi:winged helix-turn-helix domain-containing protein [Haloarcula rubripromontorii]|uniref:Transcriptional regulator n=1 Tax=Haloarcula rubripromontorii TaxID=1705562 RepID=A0A0N1IUK2_9EURY|nr:winged helix-turn-helix domain-containing protein [Haloarcula rubripromontorii]KOX93034.1 transcriptional regulator [Haloarcula rubripromontorii]NLV06621.1 winged helix-turn-helix transcriptional regulator [Haloarcula rubripromontorii]